MPQFKVSQSVYGVTVDAIVTIDQSSPDWNDGDHKHILDANSPITSSGQRLRDVTIESATTAALAVRSAIKDLNYEAFCAHSRRQEKQITEATAAGKAEALKLSEEALTAKNTELATKDQTILDLNAKVTAAEETDRALKAALAYITELETAAKQEAAAQQQAKDRENERRRNKRAADKARATRPTSKRK